MSQELEASIGGLYSILTQELQLPLVRRLMHILNKQRKLPAFPNGSSGEPLVNPKPVTGLEAIGRGDDRNKLIEFITAAQTTLGPEVMMQYINVDEALRRLAASGSIDTTNLVKTKEQLQQEAEAAAQAQQQSMEQQQLMDMMKSPAAAQIAKNYTQPGATYGPQFTEEGGVPGPQPNASQTQSEAPESLVGPPASPEAPPEYEVIQIGEVPERKVVEVEKPVVTVDDDGVIQIK